MKVYALTAIVEFRDNPVERHALGVYKTLKEAQDVMLDWKHSFNRSTVSYIEEEDDVEIETMPYFMTVSSKYYNFYIEQGIDEFEV